MSAFSLLYDTVVLMAPTVLPHIPQATAYLLPICALTCLIRKTIFNRVKGCWAFHAGSNDWTRQHLKSLKKYGAVCDVQLIPVCFFHMTFLYNITHVVSIYTSLFCNRNSNKTLWSLLPRRLLLPFHSWFSYSCYLLYVICTHMERFHV